MHPFFLTWGTQLGRDVPEIVGGDGPYLLESDGSRWLDLGSMSYQASLGLGHPRIVAALQRQAATLSIAPPNVSFAAKTELSKKLLALAPPGFTKVFYACSGAEANENAMKMARLATGRLKFMARYRSYHGATMGALTLTGDYRRPPLEPLLGNVVRVLGDDPAYLEEVMELEGPGTIAAVFMEPIPGANGVLLPRPDYWQRMRAACDRHGTLLVADEVLTGFGRTGRVFGVEHEGVVPDMITVAKALTAGYSPLSAVLVHERVARVFDERPLVAGLTNYAHPLGCASALEALSVYEEEDLYRRASQLEAALLGPLEDLAVRHSGAVTGVRGRGLLAAVDVVAEPSFWRRLSAELRARKLLLHVYPDRGTLVLAPALNIDESVLEQGLNALCEALEEGLK